MRALATLLTLLATTFACGGGGDGSPDAGGDATSPDGAGGLDAPAPLDAAGSDGAGPDAAPGVTTLRVHYDTGLGNRISVRGDGAGLAWTQGQDCTWSTGNVWVCEVPAVAAFEWKPLFNDATWAPGANWRAQPGATVDVYPHFFASSGRIVAHRGFAAAAVDDRDVLVYLPPGYDENPLETYPVVFMHDGQNLFDAATAFGGVEWRIDEAMDALAGGGGIREAIIVGVYNTASRIHDYTPTVDGSIGSGGGADAYLDFLADELRPFIAATYRVAPGRVGLAGSSLGGLVSLYGCWQRPTVFDRCGVFSPSLWWDEGYLPALVAADPATAADKPLTIYLDSGDSGASNDGMAATAAMRDLLVSKGWVLDASLRYVLGEGHAHNETAWAARAPAALAFLLDDPDRI
ncbi:MAG: alpha/beta hydrolase [Kofleriaceae bacterium]|nr:alpha/beta hydrolase [Kofleriaceae bacterium]MCL4223642.1 alpha/beta hydrolase [Myxococcales bacterium]